jgi:hypothetical protein
MVLANSSNLSKTYQPERATMSTESFVDFLRNDFPCSLEDIPGIPASAVAKLYKHQIFTAFQLFGKFLSFKTNTPQECTEQASLFCEWLANMQIDNVCIHSVTRCIANKANMMFPGMYNDLDF